MFHRVRKSQEDEIGMFYALQNWERWLNVALTHTSRSGGEMRRMAFGPLKDLRGSGRLKTPMRRWHIERGWAKRIYTVKWSKK
jgi:hypothetical protein